MKLAEQLRVKGKVDLRRIDPSSTPGLPTKKAIRKDPKGWAQAEVAAIGADLLSLQERLFASAKSTGDQRRVLVVLQAMDCGGKDGTVKHVVGQLNPLGLRITGFGVPTAEEREHDFLWRIRKALPDPGLIGVFNRSHYEDVLVARVNKLVPDEVWQARYEEINTFEAQLAANGLTFVKIMLHISKDEQKARLLERLDDPTKHWKYNPSDLDSRERWDDYHAAYQAALTKCSLDATPWYVVPADRKWYRNWAVATLLRDALAGLDPHYPAATYNTAKERARLLAT